MNAKEYKGQLKAKTPEAVDAVCNEMAESSLTTEEWRKVFSKTLMKELLKTGDVMIAIHLSSAFWKQDPKLWEEYIAEFLSTKKLLNNAYLNGLIRYGDERANAMVQRAVEGSALKVSGTFEEYGQPELSSEIDVEFAKKLAAYPDAISLHVGTLDREVAGILSNRSGPVLPGYLGFKDFEQEDFELPLDTPEFSALIEKICDDAARLGDELYLHLTEITPDIANILGSFEGACIRLGEMKALSVGVAKRLARFEPANPESRFSYLEVMGSPWAWEEGDDFGLEIMPDALAEFRNYRGELQLNVYGYKMTDTDAEGLGQHPGPLSLGMSEWPEPEQLRRIIRNKCKLDFGFIGEPSLDIDVATVLAEFKGDLYINGLSNVADEAAKALTALRSRLKMANVENLSEKGFKQLLDSGADLAW